MSLTVINRIGMDGYMFVYEGGIRFTLNIPVN